ncbi:MAG: DUF4838 domain-containing protein [Flavobacteriaceae bacterium]
MRAVLCAFLLFFIISCEDNTLKITENGTSAYEILYSDSATESEVKAAEILQQYISEISGVTLELRKETDQKENKKKIYIGNLDKKELRPQEISIHTKDQDLYIAGGSDLATIYAVFEFLEKYLGCRWYAPDAAKIPSVETISLQKIAYTYLPEITTRTVHSRLFYENTDYADRQKVTYEAFPMYAPSARVHTFHKFLPEEKFYEDHPEYFALRGEQRLPTQLCLTNEKVLEIVKDSVAALFNRYPEASVVSVSQDDNQQHCHCDNCSKIDEEEGSPSGTMIRFVNAVAKDFPEKQISTLAYQYTRRACKTKPADNVLITLCSIECDRSAPIAEKCTDFTTDLEAWGRLTNNIRIWDYTTQFTNFLAPFPNLYTLQPNIQLFRNNNAKWIFEQHSNNPSELFELRSYITAKLLWDPEQDFDTLLTDFTDGYYEEAGPYVKEYIERIHTKLSEDANFFLFLYGDPSEAFSSYLNPDLLEEYITIFDEAEKAVKTKPDIQERVKMARLGIDYAVLEASRKNITPSLNLLTSNDEGKRVENPRVKDLINTFKETTSNNEIRLMNEMGFTVDEYLKNYTSALEIAKKPNKAKGKKVVSLTKPKKYANEDPMVLTDGALGGSSFYANWLGYEGNDMEVVLDLGEAQDISNISMAFLQVTNHIVFFPSEVNYYGSVDNQSFVSLGKVANPAPLHKKSKVNDIKYFDLDFGPRKIRYLKVVAKNTKTPYWHHAAGLPSWVFADEILVD